MMWKRIDAKKNQSEKNIEMLMQEQEKKWARNAHSLVSWLETGGESYDASEKAVSETKTKEWKWQNVLSQNLIGGAVA